MQGNGHQWINPVCQGSGIGTHPQLGQRDPPSERVSVWKRGIIRSGKATGTRLEKARRQFGQRDPPGYFFPSGFRKDLPSMTTVWAWCRSRSMAALASSSSTNKGGHSSRSRLLVRIMDPRS